MARAIRERMYTDPRHGYRDRNAYQIEDNEVKDLKPDQKLYSIAGEAPDGYYVSGKKKVHVKGAGYTDHMIFSKMPEPEKAKDESTSPAAAVDEEVTPPKTKTGFSYNDYLNHTMGNTNADGSPADSPVIGGDSPQAPAMAQEFLAEKMANIKNSGVLDDESKYQLSLT